MQKEVHCWAPFLQWFSATNPPIVSSIFPTVWQHRICVCFQQLVHLNTCELSMVKAIPAQLQYIAIHWLFLACRVIKYSMLLDATYYHQIVWRNV